MELGRRKFEKTDNLMRPKARIHKLMIKRERAA
jgi:hypothetical protein